jgi:mannose-6-phosphate isomerase-like protein (cupin superfamily)
MCEDGGMHVVDSGYTPGEYVETLHTAEMSFGTYLIPVGGTDEQTPHAEDEIYAVARGRARIVTPTGSVDVGPGSVVFVPAGEEHRFVEITEELALLVFFAPPFRSREAP